MQCWHDAPANSCVATMRISGYSTARFSTWYYLDELKLLFDAGDGVSSALASKCQRVQHVFLSHADRDHIGGLLQFNQLAARSDRALTYYYPKDSGSFPAFRDFIEQFDPNLAKACWVAVEAGQRIPVASNHVVEVGENDHIAISGGGDAGLTKSLDFRVIESRRRLKLEFAGLAGAEIGRLRAEHGDDHITNTLERPLFGFSGDAPSFDAARWRNTEILVHEATFIAPDAADRGHCELGEVIRGATGLDLKALVLGHFSTRYDADFIRAAIMREAEAAMIAFPIYAVLPLTTVSDVLAGEPVWPGSSVRSAL